MTSLTTAPLAQENTKYVIYCAIFPNGKRYIGITRNFRKRQRSHLYQAATKDGYAFHNAIMKFGASSIRWVILYRCSKHLQACEKERFYIQKFQTFGGRGYNLTLGGEIGGKWNWELVANEIKRLNIRTRTEWEKVSPNSYAWAFANRVAREIAKALGVSYKAQYWSYSKVLAEVKELGIKQRSEWFLKSQNSYAYASKHKFIHKIAKVLKWRERNSWSRELVIRDIVSNEFHSLQEWREKSRFSYVYAQRNGMVRDIGRLMGWTPYRKDDGWKLEELIASVKDAKAKSIQEWRDRNSRAYSYAKKYKLVDAVSKALGWREKMTWDEETCLSHIRRQGIRTRTEWARRLPGSYDYAQRRGLIDAIAHQAGLRPIKHHLPTRAVSPPVEIAGLLSVEPPAL